MKNFLSFILTFAAALTAIAVSACSSDSGGDEPEKAGLSVSKEAVTLEARGGQVVLTVSSSREWGAATTADWLTLDRTSGFKGETQLTVSAAQNPNTSEREATLTLMSGADRKYVRLTQKAADKPLYNAPEGYELVWHDEFDSGTELNPTDWTHEVQGAGWVNHELQNYVDHKTPGGAAVTQVAGGVLRINCLKENGKVYSGRVYAHVGQGWQYAYIEASIKLPKGKGTWPAFWMMPVNFRSWPADGEIDIMEEVGVNPNYVSSSLHANSHVHSNGTQVTHEMYCEGAESDFHTYAILWTQRNITTYVDGKQQLSYDNRGLGHDDWPYDAPFYLILNLAWGGDWGGMNGVNEGALPCTMEVDYVRVFQKR